MNKPKFFNNIYVDLDGVCADFFGYVKEVTGEEYNPKTSWKELEKIPNLYSKLNKFDDCACNVLSSLYHVHCNGEVQILTSMPNPTGYLWQAHRDKVDWVKSHLGDYQVNVVQGWCMKANFCYTSDDLLIDDSERNCTDWEAKGGKAILHKDWKTTLAEVKKILKGELV